MSCGRSYDQYDIHEYFIKYKQLHPHLYYISESLDPIEYNIKQFQLSLIEKYITDTSFNIEEVYSLFIDKYIDVSYIYDSMLESMLKSIKDKKTTCILDLISTYMK